MKHFILLLNNRDGVLYEDGKPVAARFITLGEAKLATFKAVREARR